MRNSKKQEKPNNIKAKEFLPKDDGQPAKGGGRREGRTSRKTRLQQRRQKNGDAKPTNDLDKFYTVRAGERKRETPGKGAFSLSLSLWKKRATGREATAIDAPKMVSFATRESGIYPALSSTSGSAVSGLDRSGEESWVAGALGSSLLNSFFCVCVSER